MNQLTLDEVAAILNLSPLEHEGGLHRQTYIDDHSSAIYYLVGGQHRSELHRLDAVEVYHWYAGDPLLLVQVDYGEDYSEVVLGSNLEAGERPQHVVPAGVWQGSMSLGAWSLIGTTMAPPFNWRGFELAGPDLIAKYGWSDGLRAPDEE